jgi:hypothetical protein
LCPPQRGASLTTLIATYLSVGGVGFGKLQSLRTHFAQAPNKLSTFEWIVFAGVVLFIFMLAGALVSGFFIANIVAEKSQFDIIQPPIIQVLSTTFIGFVLGSLGTLFQK